MTSTFKPFWGPIDSNIDWCESNYAYSPYVAEFFNTLSSLPIVFYGLFGILMHKQNKLETRFFISFLILLLVGLGSTAFHLTLRRHAQALDELPMMLATLVLLYNALDVRNAFTKPKENNFFDSGKIKHRFGLKVFLLFLGIILTSIYLAFPQYFQLFFWGYSSILVSFSWIMLKHIFRICGPIMKVPESVLTKKEKEQLQKDLNSAPEVKLSYLPHRMMFFGAVGYMGGFVLWLIENSFCDRLPNWAYFHAIWHLAASWGTYHIILCQMVWRSEIHRLKVEYKELLRGFMQRGDDSIKKQKKQSQLKFSEIYPSVLPYITVDIED